MTGSWDDETFAVFFGAFVMFFWTFAVFFGAFVVFFGAYPKLFQPTVPLALGGCSTVKRLSNQSNTPTIKKIYRLEEPGR